MTQLPESPSPVPERSDRLLEARDYIRRSRPRAAEGHLLRTSRGGHLFVTDGSRLFDAPDPVWTRLEGATGSGKLGEGLAALGFAGQPRIDDTPLKSPPLHALSLAVAQKCNLGCTYCYAQQGSFGSTARNMSLETATRAADLLLDGATPAARLNLAFLGGEPLANRPVIQAVTRHAAERARSLGLTLTFSITTNGTLLTPGDAEFFEEHGFAVTLSLDGSREVHDRQRPFKDGRGSFDRILERVRPLLARQHRMQVSARVTVSPSNLALRPTLEAFLAEGFQSVGFSPLLRSPNGTGELGAADFEVFLAEMIDCGREYLRKNQRGERYAFANLVNALREIGKGTHRPYPCGAGAGYLGVSADGDLAACHRFVGDPEGGMGTLGSGVDLNRQDAWLAERHVHRQEPCNGCWARYLCGGGCHHEVIQRGRPACDYIRGWLHFCLEAYLQVAPDSTGVPN